MAIPIVSWGTRCLIEVHDAPGSGRHGRLTDQLEKWWAKAVRARVVCHSTSVADAVVRHWGIPRSRVELIPVAVDLSHVGDPGTAPGPPGTLRVLAVGRLVASKRFDLAITAVADAPGVHLDIVGEGPEHQRLAELARSLAVSDRVRLVGSCGPEDLAAAMGHCDVVLSASDYEGFGLVLVEAMAAGRPVVATAVGGVTDIVLDGVTGRLVPAGDVAGLRGALVDLRDDPDLRRRLGTAGRRRVEEHFDVATMVAGFVACYRVLAR
jgi:glycosyltransferase involved in cell wall biosynthesis